MLSSLLLCATLVGGPINGGTVGEVYADSRDPWTLLDQKLINRELFEQLYAEGQQFRLGRTFGQLAMAADTSVGAQIAPPDAELSRFHGFYLLDSYWALRLFEGLDVNLNLAILNPSASDGYRFSAQQYGGIALHLHKVLSIIDSEPLRLDFVGIDLDVVTLGQGLLLEQVPLEGHMASLQWNGFELKEVFGGRLFWPDDDMLAVSLGALEGSVELRYVTWLVDEINPGETAQLELVDEAVEPGRDAANFAGASFRWRLLPRLRVAGEYVARLRGKPRHGVLGRVDFLDSNLAAIWQGLELHVGYQFRFYERGFGPRDTLVTASALPNVPVREDAYVTNSFEYFAVSKFYDQWSHTAMVEARLPVGERVGLVGDLEFWHRTLRDPKPGTKRVAYIDRFGRAPGYSNRWFYRIGWRVRPWANAPHRVGLFFANKFVASRLFAVEPDSRRFVHDELFLVEVEAFL